MRKNTFSQIVVFSSLPISAVALGILSANALLKPAPLGDYRGLAIVSTSMFFLYVWAIALYRIYISRIPLTDGELVAGSRMEFVAQANFLFYLMLFNSLIRTTSYPYR